MGQFPTADDTGERGQLKAQMQSPPTGGGLVVVSTRSNFENLLAATSGNPIHEPIVKRYPAGPPSFEIIFKGLWFPEPLVRIVFSYVFD
jgi:hypothetical protein